MEISELYSYSFIDLNTFRISDLSTLDVSSNLSKEPTLPNIPKPITLTEEGINVSVEPENKVLCRMCGRVLTEPTSRVLGMGPSCYKQFRAEHSKQINLLCYRPVTKE